MMTRAVGLVLSGVLLLASCTPVSTAPEGAASGREVSWKFRVKPGDPPLSDAILIVDGRPHVVVQGAAGEFRSVAAADYASWGIPAHAIAGAMIWWAGGGEVLYAAQEAGAIKVYRRYLEERRRPGRFQPVATIP